MRILVCSKRDLSSVVILNDLLGRLIEVPEVSVALMLAERTRPVETVVPELVRMKALERDLPFGVFFPLIDGRSTSREAAELALAEIMPRDEVSEALAESRPGPAARSLHTPGWADRSFPPFVPGCARPQGAEPSCRRQGVRP